MYVIFPIVLLFLMLCSVLFHFRKRRIIRRICSMSVQEKVCKLNELTQPFGFEYLLSQDIFVSCLDAWQRNYGYSWLFDSHASRFNMVFDCEPVYFDYDGCTWLMEFWKGQYGINTGAEAGLYKASTLIPKERRKQTLFHSISNEEMPVFDLELRKGATLLFRTSRRHWWLAAFSMGQYTPPELLSLRIHVTFPCTEMRCAFVNGLLEAGYSADEICICGPEVSFCMTVPHTVQPRCLHRIRAAFAQWKNRVFLSLYRQATRPFCFTMDKLLYLYEYLPYAFRHMLSIQHKKCRKRH